MTTHYLKTTEHWFDRVAAGEKTAELRRHDRDFQVGDELVLVRTKPGEIGNAKRIAANEADPRRTITVEISHVLPHHAAPDLLPDGVVLLSFHLMEVHESVLASALRNAPQGGCS